LRKTASARGFACAQSIATGLLENAAIELGASKSVHVIRRHYVLGASLQAASDQMFLNTKANKAPAELQSITMLKPA